MRSTRRDFLWMAASTLALGQGITTRNVKPLPRGKPSGIPFLAHFTDVAVAAGLTAPVIYGGLKQKNYIVETVGCGVAFLDYDNDGWLDIFVLCGTRMDEPVPNSSNRLYKNNRDGTFSDVTEKAGLLRTGWASGVTVGDYNNDGCEDATTETERLPTLPGRQGCCTRGIPVGDRVVLFWTTIAMGISIFLSPTMLICTWSGCLNREQTRTAITRV
jgi:hypothetical protein